MLIRPSGVVGTPEGLVGGSGPAFITTLGLSIPLYRAEKKSDMFTVHAELRGVGLVGQLVCPFQYTCPRFPVYIYPGIIQCVYIVTTMTRGGGGVGSHIQSE